MVTHGDPRSIVSGAAPPCRGPRPLSSRLQRGNGHKPPPVTMLVLSHIVMLHWDLRFPWSANFIFSWWNFECNFVTSAVGSKLKSLWPTLCPEIWKNAIRSLGLESCTKSPSNSQDWNLLEDPHRPSKSWNRSNKHRLLPVEEAHSARSHTA